VIASALRRFEKLKPAYAAKVQANQQWRAVHQQDSIALAAHSKTTDLYQESLATEHALRADATAKLKVSKGKATRRGLLVAIEALGLALAGYVILTK
jgi:ferric-dicitrate binding protein FerR (iron transport regulator)